MNMNPKPPLPFQTVVNYSIAGVIVVWAVALLFIIISPALSPAPELPPVRDTRGGIPVISLNADTLTDGFKSMCERLAKGEKPQTDEDKAIAESGIDFDALCSRVREAKQAPLNPPLALK